MALVAGLTFAACASLPVHEIVTWPDEPPHLVRISIHKGALAQLESLATVTRSTRNEQCACVTHFGALPVQKGGWIIAIIAIGPSANFHHSDSLYVYGVGPLCPKGTPIVHSHIVPNEVWGRPSSFDLDRVQILRDSDYAAPFHVLVSVGDKPPSKITIYGLR